MQKFTAKLFREGESKYVGTAWLFCGTHALTAAHCVGNRKNETLTLGTYYLYFPPKTLAAEGVRVDVLSIEPPDFNLDAAVLTIDQQKIANSIDVNCGPLPTLVPWPPGEIHWSSYGFPHANEGGLDINGYIDSPAQPRNGTQIVQVTCNQGGFSALDGVSGAPAQHGSMVFGLIRYAPQELAETVMFVAPICAIADKFPIVKANLLNELITAGLVKLSPALLENLGFRVGVPLTNVVSPTLSPEQNARRVLDRFAEVKADLVLVRRTLPVVAQLQQSAPVIRSRNLPAQPKPIGRSEEVREIKELLADPERRLVTITGTAGLGKTRIALQVSAEVAPTFLNGVLFVDLGDVSDRSAVDERSRAAAEIALRLRPMEAKFKVVRDEESVLSYLRDLQILLVLDNFERLQGAASLAVEILQTCPHVKLLVASQVRVGVADSHATEWERVYPVRGLATPDPEHLPSLDKLREIPSVQLFLQRASDVGAKAFSLNETNAPAIAAICAKLDGLPLAIELVAAQCEVQHPVTILEDLQSEYFGELLERIFSTSYAQLGDDRLLFRRLSLFKAGCTLKAAQEFCGADGQSAAAVRSGLYGLVRRNLLTSSEGLDGSVRFRMLQTIRRFGLGRLKAEEQSGSLSDKYAAFQLARLEAIEQQLTSPERERRKLLEMIDEDIENYREVIQRSQSPDGDLEIGLRLAGSLFWFWNLRAYFDEGVNTLTALLDVVPNPARTLGRAKSLYALGGLRFLQGHYAEARKRLTECVAIARQPGFERVLAYALIVLGMVDLEAEDHQGALACQSEAKDLLSAAKDRWGYALALNDLGRVVDILQGYAAAENCFSEGLSIWDALGDSWGRPLTLTTWGFAALRDGKFEQARKLMNEALAIQKNMRDRWGEAASYSGLGNALLAFGDYSGAAGAFAESLAQNRELGRQRMVVICLQDLSRLADATGDAQHAAEFAAAAEGLHAGQLLTAQGAALDSALAWARTAGG